MPCFMSLLQHFLSYSKHCNGKWLHERWGEVSSGDGDNGWWQAQSDKQGWSCSEREVVGDQLTCDRWCQSFHTRLWPCPPHSRQSLYTVQDNFTIITQVIIIRILKRSIKSPRVLDLTTKSSVAGLTQSTSILPSSFAPTKLLASSRGLEGRKTSTELTTTWGGLPGDAKEHISIIKYTSLEQQQQLRASLQFNPWNREVKDLGRCLILFTPMSQRGM